MGFYQFKDTILVKAHLNAIWDFISSPKNLKEITPPKMGFQITSVDLPEKMYEGMIIRYRVSPLPNYTTTWVTEITQIEEKKYFVDEQRHGPYKMWHHEHILVETVDGIEMTDIVSYIPPMGILGNLANALFIEKQIRKIFEYRKRALDQIFH